MKKIISLALVLATSMAFGMSVQDLNKAPKSELMKIKGIGSKKADAIIKYRAKTPFKTMSDIENVTGIGSSLSQNIDKDVYKKTTTKKKSSTTTTTATKSSNTNKSSKLTKDTEEKDVQNNKK